MRARFQFTVLALFVVNFAFGQSLVFRRLAGAPGGTGFQDGTGTEARFSNPQGIVADPSGNLYVADSGNNTLRRVTPDGIVTTFAGTAGPYVSVQQNGRGGRASFYSPSAITIDATGNLYVSEYNRIQKVSPNGMAMLLAGGTYGTADGQGPAAGFRAPSGIVVDSSGTVYVADRYNHAVRMITSAGLVTTFAGLTGSSGYSDGSGAAARFRNPIGIARDAAGYTFIADSGNYVIRRISPTGEVTTFAGLAGARGSTDGDASTARFVSPGSMAIDASGNLYVCDSWSLRKVTPAGSVSTITTGSLQGVVVTASGEIYAVRLTDVVRVNPNGTVTPIAGGMRESVVVDGTGDAARFLAPNRLVRDGNNGFIVADSTAIRRVNEAGSVTTIKSVGISCSVAIPDGAGGLFAGCGPSIVRISATGEVTTLAGGQYGTADGTGTAAQFNDIQGLAADTSGNLFAADTWNHTIRKVTPEGVVSTFAGQPGVSGFANGVGAGARFYTPMDIAIDDTSNIYVADRNNFCIRKITPDATVSTFASGFSYGPNTLTLGSAGTLYADDAYRLYSVSATGVITCIGGVCQGSSHLGSVDGTGLFARFDRPYGLAAGNDGALYLAEQSTGVIRSARPSLPDSATVDVATGATGATRQLGVGSPSASSFSWRQVRRPTGSTATLSATNVANPTFTPDIPDIYEFELTATSASGSSITRVKLEALCSPPPAPTITPSPAVSCTRGAAVTLTATAGYDTYLWSTGETARSITVYPSAKTLYSLTTFVGLCSSTASYSVDVTPAPIVSPTIASHPASGGSGTIAVTAPCGMSPVSNAPWIVITSSNVTSIAYSVSANGGAAARRGSIDVGGTAVAILQAAATGAAGQSLMFRTLAGTTGNDSQDGAGGNAGFNSPRSVVLDGSGYAYVADGGNCTVRKVAPDGTVSTLAGLAGICGFADGTGAAARFSSVSGIAIGPNGDVFVADNTRIRRITPRGVVSTFAGSSYGTRDGAGDVAQFRRVGEIAFDGVGNLFVLDVNGYTVRKITAAAVVSTFAGSPGISGSSDGIGVAARFTSLAGIAVAGSGDIYVSQTNGSIRRITSDGTVTTISMSTYGASGMGTNPSTGEVFVAGSTLRIIAGTSITSGPTIGITTNDVAVSSAGELLLTAYDHRILKYAGGTATTVAGSPWVDGWADGVGGSALFQRPSGIVPDGRGGFFVTQWNEVRRISPAGEVSTVAGSAGFGYADAAGSSALFRTPAGMVMDTAGNLFIADPGNYAIRKLSPDGFVTTFAGGTYGTADGFGTAAQFRYPIGMAIDAANNIYVVDSSAHTVRKITPAAEVTTIAGAAGVVGFVDGTGTAARFRNPNGIVIDAAGDLYVADSSNYRIRKMTTAGVVTTFAGSGSQTAADGPTATAGFVSPASLAWDSSGNLLVGDSAGIRLISGGNVTTVGGAPLISGNRAGVGTFARFGSVAGLAVDDVGSIYVADSSAHAIKVGAAGLLDAAIIDSATGLVGASRQLGVTPQTAASYNWRVVRRPVGSTAALSSTTGASVNFTPDAPDVYEFELTATGDGINSITRVMLSASCTPPAAPTITSVPIVACSPGAAVTLSASTGYDSYYWSNGETSQSIVVNPIVDTPYTVTAYSGFCSSTSSYFVRVAPTASLSSNGGSFPAAGGGGSFAVTTPCSWSATSSASWLTFTTTSTSVNYSVAPNVAAAPRRALITVGDTAFAVVQGGTAGAASDQPVTFRTFVGMAASGSDDGTGVAAGFSSAQGLAIDNGGNVYVADTNNCTIRKVTPQGSVTTFAGVPGNCYVVDGPVPNARLSSPRGLAFGPGGDLFVNESNRIRRITPQGFVSTFAGGSYGSGDGIGTAAQFKYIWRMAFDASGNLYVTDRNSYAIRKVTSNGVVTTIAGSPDQNVSIDGVGTAARFYYPQGIAVDGTGIVYVTQSNGVIRKIATDLTVTTVSGTTSSYDLTSDSSGNVYLLSGFSILMAATGTGNITTVAAVTSLCATNGFARDSAGVFYVSRYCSPWSGQATGDLARIAPGVWDAVSIAGTNNSGNADGSGTAARLGVPAGIARDGHGGFVLTEISGGTIRRMTAKGKVTTIAGGRGPGWADGNGVRAQFDQPYGIAVGPSGTIYVAELNNSTIRKISGTNDVTTFVGTARSSGFTDGNGAVARFKSPEGVAVDASENLYVADSGNHAIRKITPSGDVTTIAGTGTAGFVDGNGTTASFSSPRGVAFAANGDLYVADSGNYVIRRIAANGEVTTFAGTGARGSSDGTLTTAKFDTPFGLVLDAAGNLLVQDLHGIRRITPAGNVTTLGGVVNVWGNREGTGIHARFTQNLGLPAPGLAVDDAGTIYVTDEGSNVIRIGSPGISDAATIDTPTGTVGVVRQLGIAAQSTTSVQWRQVRRPSASNAILSSTTNSAPTFTPDVAGNYEFELTATGDGCESITRVTLAVTAPSATPPAAPSNLVATAASATSIDVTWTASNDTNYYEVLRSYDNGTVIVVSTPTSNRYNDYGRLPGKAYVYKVRAVNTAGTSPPSNADIATTIMFSDDPLLPGVTPVREAHFTEARTAVNAVRLSAGLALFSFTDPSLTGVVIRSQHIAELRTALTTARMALGLGAMPWTNTADPGTPIRALDLTEIRNGVK